jgi:hypothetical protein
MTADVGAAGVLMAWVEALADRDSTRLADVLADDVHLRALLPSGLVDLTGRDALLGEFKRWFDGMDIVRVADATAQPFSDRILLHYELEVGKDDRRWIVAQSVASIVKDGRVETLDLVCTGFRPPEPAA